MPSCPHCQAEYQPGQHFCSQCGAPLPQEEAGSSVCPRCKTQVQATQKYCHECGAPLRPGLPSSTPGSQRLIALGIVAVVVLVGLVVTINLVRYLTTRPAELTREPPAPAAPAPTPAPSVPPAATPPAVTTAPGKPLEAELADVLADLRQANLNKDIVLYMSRFSTLFPEYDKKREATLKTWENYDFRNLAYNLSKIRSLGQDDAVAEVSWSILVYNREKKRTETSDFAYQVWFSRELGRWRIKKIEEL